MIVFLRNSSVSLLFCSWLPWFRSGYETAFYLFLCRHNERARTGEEKTWSRALLVAVKSLFNPTPKFPAAHEFKNLYWDNRLSRVLKVSPILSMYCRDRKCQNFFFAAKINNYYVTECNRSLRWKITKKSNCRRSRSKMITGEKLFASFQPGNYHVWTEVILDCVTTALYNAASLWH